MGLEADPVWAGPEGLLGQDGGRRGRGPRDGDCAGPIALGLGEGGGGAGPRSARWPRPEDFALGIGAELMGGACDAGAGPRNGVIGRQRYCAGQMSGPDGRWPLSSRLNWLVRGRAYVDGS